MNVKRNVQHISVIKRSKHFIATEGDAKVNPYGCRRYAGPADDNVQQSNILAPRNLISPCSKSGTRFYKGRNRVKKRVLQHLGNIPSEGGHGTKLLSCQPVVEISIPQTLAGVFHFVLSHVRLIDRPDLQRYHQRSYRNFKQAAKRLVTNYEV